jgi:glycosyltransferase involved in cell wall biosynthesis
MEKLRIAFIGQKGLPARYGGVETHVEQIAARLASRGHQVTAYCRDWFRRFAEDAGVEFERAAESGEIYYRGIRLLFKANIHTKHLDAASNTFFSTLDAATRHRYDIVHFHGVGPSAFAWLPKLSSCRIVSTVHALDWRQAKWGRIASWFIKTGEEIGVRNSHGVIAVSHLLVDYLASEYGVSSTYIPNGATMEPLLPLDRIKRFGLEDGNFILAVGRIIPDRNLHHLIEAFGRLEGSTRLVIVGSEYPRTVYSDRLQAMADERVLFVGNQFEETLRELYSNCRLYVLASSVEGLPITVCEAMAHRRPILLSDIPENREVGGDAVLYFKCCDVNDLYEKLNVLLEDEETRQHLAEAARHRVEEHFNWDRIAEAVEAFYLKNL